MAHPTVVHSAEEVRQNIQKYQEEIASSERLAARAPYVRAWYAEPIANGAWLFAPSKFAGYSFSSAKDYLAASGSGGDRDGRETELTLRAWYQEVDPNSRLGEKLFASLRSFLSQFNVVPNKLARINVPRGLFEVAERSSSESAVPMSLLERIVSTPDICGGRPIIRGTRMRVVDILEALARGATREQLLSDFDYLSNDDITAALLYASQSADHRMVATR